MKATLVSALILAVSIVASWGIAASNKRSLVIHLGPACAAPDLNPPVTRWVRAAGEDPR